MFAAAEPIRLIIWDLDDTFWKGTLSEGGVEFLPENRTIVRELAQRGIVSAICSKNDFECAKERLVAEGLWDYFVFPSINWQPKGPRIKSLIELAQLRPASVLLIDDNPFNLEEAKHFTPELQVHGAGVLADILAHPALAGGVDPEMTRLQQYKSLELRKLAQGSEIEDAEAFLRQSKIRVAIEHDLDHHLDRIVELLNRSNQLNFTKRRLPQELNAARSELQALLHSHEVQAGLLRVRDRYGDHGDAGFYALHNNGELLHFCFSCRVLGLGLETWLYRKLGRPRLNVVDAVSSDPTTDERAVDWIALDRSSQQPSSIEMNRSARTTSRFDWIVARGGCDLQALSHYFKLDDTEVIGEFNVGRQGFDARADHSMFLRYALSGLNAEAVEECAKLGYRPEDFATALSASRPGRGLVVLSFWADMAYALYRHRRLGFLIPFALSGCANHTLDARAATANELPQALRDGWLGEALRVLQADYEFAGVIDEALFKFNLQLTLTALPIDTQIVLLQANTCLWDAHQGALHRSAAYERFNRWLVEIANMRANVTVLNVRDVIHGEHEVSDWSHFDRLVYYRMQQRICELTG